MEERQEAHNLHSYSVDREKPIRKERKNNNST